jgi:pimeloyl-ACP methyl ester carboxylesterase
MAPLRRSSLSTSRGIFSILENDRPSETNRSLVIWAHATGFHAAAYTPLLEAIADAAHILAFDARGHGHTAAADDPNQLTSWRVYYDDLISILDTVPAGQRVILAGHSAGATSAVFAAAARIDRVDRLVIVEPVFYPPIIGKRPRELLMQASTRRRSVFPSLGEAFTSYRSRSAFKGFSDEWLRAYVQDAFRETKSGQVELRCTTQWEYQSFKTNERWPWRAIAKCNRPTTVLVAEHASSCPPSARWLLRLMRTEWSVREIANTSHLLPMEQPHVVQEALLRAATFNQY